MGDCDGDGQEILSADGQELFEAALITRTSASSARYFEHHEAEGF